jgi:hypothetical protein
MKTSLKSQGSDWLKWRLVAISANQMLEIRDWFLISVLCITLAWLPKQCAMITDETSDYPFSTKQFIYQLFDNTLK